MIKHLLFSLLIAPSVFAEIKVHPDCTFFTSGKPNSKLVNHWVDSPGAVQVIQGQRIPGGTSLITGKTSDTYLTDYFFKESKIQPHESFEKFKLGTYSYYQQKANVRWHTGEDAWFQPVASGKKRSNRGGGRDHFINLDSKNNKFRAVKGSGTNTRFSKSNIEDWRIDNFRRNGLMLLEDGLLEYIIAKQFKEAGAPVLEHPDLVMFPKNFYEELVQNGVSEEKYMVQMHRELSSPRESFAIKKTPKKSDINEEAGNPHKLVSDLYLLNAAHGAINPENMVYGAKLIDMGHVSFGYPYASYNYRCTLCVGIEGGSSDKTFVGLVDHYFGNNVYKQGSRSYTAELSKADYKKILKESSLTLNGGKEISNSFELSKNEKEALDKLFKEGIFFYGKSQRKKFYQEKLNEQFQELYSMKIDDGKKVQSSWGEKIDEWDKHIWPVRFSLSYKFFWQLAAQKLFIKDAQYRTFIERARTLVAPQVREEFDVIIRLFEKIMKSHEINQETIAPIFLERLPANLLLKEIRKRINRKRSYESVVAESQKIIKDFEKPIEYKPEVFRENILELADHVEKKTEEYMIEARLKAEKKLNHTESWDESWGDWDEDIN